MAMLLGAVKLMVQLKDKLKRRVKFIFQPCEEQHPGGAKLMVEQGVLNDVDEIYGLHIEPNIASAILDYGPAPRWRQQTVLLSPS